MTSLSSRQPVIAAVFLVTWSMGNRVGTKHHPLFHGAIISLDTPTVSLLLFLIELLDLIEFQALG